MAERRAQPLDGEPAARVLVAGASGLRRRARRRARLAPSRASSWSAPPRAPTPARDSAGSTRATAADVELTELDVDEAEDCDAAIVAYPHGAAAPVVAGLRGPASPSSTSPPTSACATPRPTASWYGELGAAGAAGGGRLRAARALPRRDPRGRARRQPRLLPDRDDPRARPAGGRRADRGRGRRRQVRRLRSRPGRRRPPALRHRRRERHAVRDRRATATSRRSARSWRSSPAPRPA